MGDRYSLGLDIASTLGYAIACNGVIEDSGIVNLGQSKDLLGTRERRFFNFLSKVGGGCREVFYERVQVHGKWNQSASVFYNLEGILNLFFGSHNVLYKGYHQSTLKSRFISRDILNQYQGNQNAAKFAVCHQCHELGWPRGERNTALYHDEADACMALFVGLREQGIEPTFGNYK